MEPPRVTSGRVVYENRWMRLHEDRTERAGGTPGLPARVEKPPAAVIVPRETDHVWLIEQFRHPIGGRFAAIELEAMIDRGRVRDAATVAAWHLATR